MKRNYFLIYSLLCLGIGSVKAQFTDLVNFSGTNGSYPGSGSGYGTVITSGNVMYGMTEQGGANNDGCIFSVNTDGTNYSDLHDFTGSSIDGKQPVNSLTLSGTTLYGMTYSGGQSNKGIIFSINTNGGSFTDLHDFNGSSSDGEEQSGSLILSGSTLFGMTYGGGSSGAGIIFSIYTNGNSFTDLHDFSGINSDGAHPQGSLTLSGSTLYGMTGGGGLDGIGIIFSISTSGGSITTLHNFTGSSSDGNTPWESLTLSGSTLYGMTYSGGLSNDGIIFSISTSGSSFSDLHDFTGNSSDGGNPYGSLTLAGSTLYGMTSIGGMSNKGIIFSIYTNATSFTDLHDFTGSSSDGENPNGSLTLSGNKLYGMTDGGGTNGDGIVFSLQESGLGLNELSTRSGTINIYPNPCNGKFTIQAGMLSGAETSIKVYNVLGEQVYSASLPHPDSYRDPKGALNVVDLTAQPNGVYFYRLVAESGELIGDGKIVVQK